MNGNASIRSIAVVGGGVVARSAALTFARAVPGVTVTLTPAPVDPAALSDWFPLLSGRGRDAITAWGMHESELADGDVASPWLASRHDEWDGGAAWFTAEGSGIAAPLHGALHQCWLLARERSGAPTFDQLLPAAVMAAAGVFAADPAAPLDQADHGWRFDARRLAEALASAGRGAGVRIGAPVVGVHRAATGDIQGLALSDGGMLRADLYVDATGSAARLARDDVFTSWLPLLPVDRVLLAAEVALPSLLERRQRTAIGWRAQWTGPRKTFAAVGFQASLAGEADARRHLPDPDGPAALVELRPGRRPGFWSGNCLALAEAAVQFGPLGLAGFAFAQAQLAMAVELLPPRSMPTLLLAEYDRRAGLRAERLRDWLAAHYLPLAAGGAGWSAAAPVLAATLAQFAQRGTIPHHDEESVSLSAWHALLIGRGLRPARPDPIAMGNDPDRLCAVLTQAAAALSDAVRNLPQYAGAGRA